MTQLFNNKKLCFANHTSKSAWEFHYVLSFVAG